MKYIVGFSLVESIVIIGIISVLTAMSLSAFPAVRAHQELVADTELIRSLLLDAKQRTINEVRHADCVNQQAPARQFLCADTGIAFQDGSIIQYANTVDDGAGARSYDNSGLRRADFVNSRHELSTTIKSGSAMSLLFAGAPPVAILYNNGNVVSGGSSASITLVASNGTERTIRVFSSGTIEVL